MEWEMECRRVGFLVCVFSFGVGMMGKGMNENEESHSLFFYHPPSVSLPGGLYG